MKALAARTRDVDDLRLLATMIGAMTMARVVTDPELSASILRQARKSLTGQ